MTQPSARLRVVVDTNLFVSGTILKRGNPHALLTAWRNSVFVLLLSESQYGELGDVFSRPKLVDRYHLTSDELANLFVHLAAAPRIVPTPMLPVSVRDSKDEHIWRLDSGGMRTISLPVMRICWCSETINAWVRCGSSPLQSFWQF